MYHSQRVSSRSEEPSERVVFSEEALPESDFCITTQISGRNTALVIKERNTHRLSVCKGRLLPVHRGAENNPFQFKTLSKVTER